MSIKIRRDEEISDVDGGWFRARWHFSFDTYHDPEYMQFGTLRVFNDDRLVPGAIWPMHPHKNIEGLTYVVEGSFRHEDDVGVPFDHVEVDAPARTELVGDLNRRVHT
ncbi:MAG TPA: pirin family protein [Actinomycetota bacterium]|nr:pirin family protein [Actinomycetota bacterium]